MRWRSIDTSGEVLLQHQGDFIFIHCFCCCCCCCFCGYFCVLRLCFCLVRICSLPSCTFPNINHIYQISKKNQTEDSHSKQQLGAVPYLSSRTWLLSESNSQSLLAGRILNFKIRIQLSSTRSNARMSVRRFL